MISIVNISRLHVLHIIPEVDVLLVSQVLEGVLVPDLLVTRVGQVTAGFLGSKTDMSEPLRSVSADEQQSENNEEDVEQDVKTEVGGEALLVSRRVGRLEDLCAARLAFPDPTKSTRESTYLWGGHVSRSPRNKSDSQGRRLLGLPCDIPGDEGEDEVTFGKVELSAVKSDQQPNPVRVVRGDTVDDGCSNNSRAAEGVSRAVGL